MKRREFITLLGGAAAWPLTARAQQPVKIYRLGYLAPARIPHLIDALLTGLRELGYVEGKNIKIEYRYGGTATLDELAAQLVDLHPDAIITVATPPAIAAKRATTTIPIVMATAGDPVRSGIVASFARPGGNVTGVTLYGSELSAKRVEVLKEAVPRTTRLAALGNARNPYSQHSWEDMEPAARALGLGSRFVESLARPGGNATGFTVMEPTISGKWLELLKEIAPHVKRAGFLFNPATAPYVKYYLDPFNAAAASLGLEAIAAPVNDRSEIEFRCCRTISRVRIVVCF